MIVVPLTAGHAAGMLETELVCVKLDDGDGVLEASPKDDVGLVVLVYPFPAATADVTGT